MAKSQKPRKAHNRKGVARGGGLLAISKHQWVQQPLPDERKANVAIAYYTSIDAMKGGYAQETHYDSIVYAINIGVILAQNGMGIEHLETLKLASVGMARCKDRWEDTGKFGLDGEALKAVEAVGDIHEKYLKIATQGQLEAAIKEMNKRVADGKANFRVDSGEVYREAA